MAITYETSIPIEEAVVLERRVPASMLNQARKGYYARKSPYPVESLVGAFQGERFITRQSRIVTMGSCFAQELARWLDQHGYSRLPHHWGVIYNPASMRQIVQYSTEPETWQPAEPFWTDASNVYDPYRKSDDHAGAYRLGASVEEAMQRLEAHRRASRDTLMRADVCVLTLGLTELWRHRADQAAFFAIPAPAFFSDERHEFHTLTFSEVRGHLDYIVSRLRMLNPNVRILFSVSPIPLSISFREKLGPYVATQESKSVLHAAVLETTQMYEGVHYMPSYEIATGNRAAYFLPDGRHVNAACVSTIMQAFESLYVMGSGA